ncbi:MAG: DUF3846 domain-containing protein [Streptosporangiaceae bacterium]
MRALLVPADGPPEVVDVAVGGGARFMRSLRARIGAEAVERFRVTDRWEFWVDEEGLAAGKAANQAATRVARDFGVQFDLRGNVVITGVDDDAAGWADLSPAQVDVILLRIA